MTELRKSAEMRPARDVLAEQIAVWVENDGGLYDYVDKLINELWRAGYRIVRSRYPMASPDDPSADLFLALNFPGVDPTTIDPDDLADDIASALNEGLAHDSGRIMVSGIPSPQWLTPATLANLRAAAKAVHS